MLLAISAAPGGAKRRRPIATARMTSRAECQRLLCRLHSAAIVFRSSSPKTRTRRPPATSFEQAQNLPATRHSVYRRTSKLTSRQNTIADVCLTFRYETKRMPPLLKTYFNPHHRSFLSTLFTATFLGSVLVVAFPCPVRPKDGLSSLINESATPVTGSSISGQETNIERQPGTGRRGVRDEIVVMMNERSGRRRFLSED